MSLDESSHDVESEPGAFANSLGCEKRIKYPVANFLRYPLAIVDYSNHHGVPFLSGIQLYTSTIWNSIDCVVDQIRPHLVQLAAESIHAWQVLINVQTQLDVFLFRLRSKHNDCVREPLRNIQRFSDRRAIHFGE